MKTQETVQGTVGTNKSLIPLTMEQLRERVPSAFQTQPHSRLSAKYQFIDTMNVVNQFIEAGFIPFGAYQWNYRSMKGRTFEGYQPHVIYLYHPDFVIMNGKGQIEEYFQITLKNSHNGFCKLEIRGGFYRLVCDNGMLAMSRDFGHLISRHMGKDLKINTQQLITTMSDQFQEMVSSVKKMKSLVLTREKRVGLAKRMLEMRMNRTNPNSKTEYNAEELLKPLRENDKGNSLWKTYNVIQEKLIKGYDFSGGRVGTVEGADVKTPRKLRPVQYFRIQLELNQQFFEAAKELA